MKDDSGRLALFWGPLLLVAVLVAVFRFAETGGGGSGSPGSRDAASDAAPAGHPPVGAAAASGPGGELRGPEGAFGPFPGYPASPRAAGPPSYPGSPPYPGSPGCPPWAAYRWAQPFPRPGDHSARYWGRGAVEWGPPIGEYGPDTRIDPYWWVAAGEGGGRTGR